MTYAKPPLAGVLPVMVERTESPDSSQEIEQELHELTVVTWRNTISIGALVARATQLAQPSFGQV